MTPAAPPPGGGLRDTTQSGGDLHLVLNNTLGAVEDGRLAILDYLAPLDIDPRVINRLEVIFEEVISNIVRHGFAAGSDPSIHVTVAAPPGVIDLTFEDDGAPFDPVAAAEPARPATLEAATPGGLGISLVRKLSAAMRYETPAPAAHGFSPNNRLIVSIAR